MMITKRALFVAFVFGMTISAAARGQGPTPADCTITWTGNIDTVWQTQGNWSTGVLPSPTDIACIPPDAFVEVDSNTPPLDVEAGALVLQADNVGETIVLVEVGTSLKIHDDSTIDGLLVLLRGTLQIVGTLTFYGGSGGGVRGILEPFQTDPTPRIVGLLGPGPEFPILIIQGADNNNVSTSMLLSGILDVNMDLINNGIVYADLSLTHPTGPPTGLALNGNKIRGSGIWRALQPGGDPQELGGGGLSPCGLLQVNRQVTGSGIWRLVNGQCARIQINARCTRLTGSVEITNGTLEVNADFETTGNIDISSNLFLLPKIEIAPGTRARFGN